MMKPGDKVTGAEADRIEELSTEAKEQEIAQIVSESGRTEEEAVMLVAWLRLFYADPDSFQRVPGIDSDLNMKPFILPYEG